MVFVKLTQPNMACRVFIRFVIIPSVTEGVITTRSNRMKFRLTINLYSNKSVNFRANSVTFEGKAIIVITTRSNRMKFRLRL